MTKAKILAWLLLAMRAWIPFAPNADAEAEAARYAAIAETARAVAWGERPVFKGEEEEARAKGALLLLSIASYEGSFSAAVDDGRVTGDGGRSWCLAQVNYPAAPGHTSLIVVNGDFKWSPVADGWTPRDLVTDRVKCFTAAYAIVRTSIRQCGNLSVYTSGSCNAKERKAKERMGRAMAWYAAHGRRELDGMEATR